MRRSARIKIWYWLISGQIFGGIEDKQAPIKGFEVVHNRPETTSSIVWSSGSNRSWPRQQSHNQGVMPFGPLEAAAHGLPPI